MLLRLQKKHLKFELYSEIKGVKENTELELHSEIKATIQEDETEVLRNQINEEIKSIEVPDFGDGTTEKFKEYVCKIMLYLRKNGNKKVKLSEIQNDDSYDLPEKRVLTTDGKRSGAKLLETYCTEYFTIEKWK